MAAVSISYLLETGVHFGHQTKRWNPKMKEYIFTSRDGIYIIDLQKTAKLIDEAYDFIKELSANGGKVLFVGTRKQASEAIVEEAKRSESYYVAERWLGGTLTNFRTIRRRVRRLEQIENMEKDGTFEKLPKKEVVKIKKEYDKLNKILCGIRDMRKLPQALFIVDPSKETIAIREARKLNIPVVGIVDTNCDPDMVDYVIPGNDDAIRAVKLITGVMANAVVEAKGGKIIDFTKADQDNSNIMEKAVESVGRNRKNRNFRPRNDRNFRPNNNRNFTPRNDRNFTPRTDNNFKPRNEVKKPVTNEQPKTVVKEQVKTVVKEQPKPVVKEQPKKVVVKEDLSTKKVTELRELAKAKSLKGYSTMKKSELIDALK